MNKKRSKKKRFYKNAKRNQVWTEEVQGREIDFADKYVYDGIYTDKYDYMRPKQKRKKYFNKNNVISFFKKFGIVVLCLLVFNVGYIFMNVYMQRHSMPVVAENEEEVVEPALNEVAFDLKSKYVESVSFDGGVMLDAVITDLQANGYNSVAFDVKREEGTIGYKSALANVDTFGAIAFPATNLKGSVAKLANEDILTVGIVHCYRDNLVPSVQKSAAIIGKNGLVYKDSRDNTYLNPDLDITYNYIKGIIQEAYDMGVKIFVLDDVNLPSSISDNYNDGFENLAKRLYKDIGTDIKLLEAVNVELKSFAPEESTTSKDQTNDSNENKQNKKPDKKDDEISQKLSSNLNNNQIYFVKTSAEKNVIKQKVEEHGISNFILSD